MAFLGCSRGLGREVAKQFFQMDSLERAILVARSQENLDSLASETDKPNKILIQDFSKKESIMETLSMIEREKPSRVFYFAGGGPFGKFADKQWKDHQWSLQVCFLTPARLLYELLQPEFEFVRQIVFIGSQIADSDADSMASSYAAGKRALKGLLESIWEEGVRRDLRLFRPGYMDTEMLPKNAKPRLEGACIVSPEDAARIFVPWALDSGAEKIKNL